MKEPATQIRRFLADYEPRTPCLVLDIDTVLARYATLTAQFPHAALRYAVKANPEPAILRALAAAGAGFDVASPSEIELSLASGARPESLSYGNTIKKPTDIAFANERGVRDFVFDAEGDLLNIAANAPGASVYVRILVGGPESTTPFGNKFGCAPELATELLLRAGELGLDPAGVSFHVGSQQLHPSAWDHAIAVAATVWRAVESRGGAPRRLNVGGGFGVDYIEKAPTIASYANVVARALSRHFPTSAPKLMFEPGRILVAEAGIIRTEVVLVSRKAISDQQRWIYLDVGRYNGLAETENEAITYRFLREDSTPDDTNEPTGPVIIAGPTCDGDDVLYQHSSYRMPLSLRAGDRLDILNAGAYTASYSSVGFNGIEPLRTYCISGGRLIDAE